jgi:winged helix-turn-helix DNA-binding protein
MAIIVVNGNRSCRSDASSDDRQTEPVHFATLTAPSLDWVPARRLRVIDRRKDLAWTRQSDPEEWWAVDREILECLAQHPAMSLTEIARQLHLSEGEATSLLAELAREGRIRICQVSLAA